MHCHCHTKQLYCGFGFFDYVIKDIVLCMFASTWIKRVLEQATELQFQAKMLDGKLMAEKQFQKKNLAIISSKLYL